MVTFGNAPRALLELHVWTRFVPLPLLIGTDTGTDFSPGVGDTNNGLDLAASHLGDVNVLPTPVEQKASEPDRPTFIDQLHAGAVNVKRPWVGP